MSNRDGTDCDVVAAQERMLRLAERDYSLSIKALALETGIPVPTLQSYKRDTMMPLAAFVKLCRVIPDDLTSLCLEPADKCVSPKEGTDDALDELACESSALTFEYLDAKRDGVISPKERSKLCDRARRVKAAARKVAP